VIHLSFSSLNVVVEEKENPSLKKWQGYRFGLFIHWGIYAQISDLVDLESKGLESWPLEWSARSWSNPHINTKEQMTNFREWYWKLNKRFNPQHFNPDEWAEAAWNAGMRYIVMTTKHHDGFSMYNTKLDNYSVVNDDCPFKRDAFGEVVKAFRKKGFGIGAYFSKPDWHRYDFWAPDTFADSRFSNYIPEERPELWSSFVKFTHGQIKEIMQQYKPDILWMDGGWIKPPAYDIGLPAISDECKAINKDIIIVNRDGGIFEDYLTPEQGGIPSVPVAKPWEVCMTMGNQWGYKKDDVYKSVPTLINILLSVVSTGGNLLLDIGPDANGRLPPDAIDRLKGLGQWMKYNAEGIYDTEPIYPYRFASTLPYGNSQLFFLSRKGRTVYIYLLVSDVIPKKLYMPFVTEKQIGDVPFNLKSISIVPLDLKLSFHFEVDYLIADVPSIALPYNYTLTLKLTEQ
jgi:alpha-L-fucosidase